MHTPFFPALRPWLAPMGSRAVNTLASWRRATLVQIEHALAPALDATLLAPAKAGPHSRQRVFTLSVTFWSWLWQVLQANASCREVLRQTQALLCLSGRGSLHPSAGAYCQARAKCPLSVLEKLFVASARSAQRAACSSALLRGRPIKIVDASTVRLPDTPAHQAAFPTSPNQYRRPGFPTLKLLVLFSLASGAILAQASGSLAVSELRLLVGLASQLVKGDILVGDRAYGQHALVYWLQSLGVDLIARLNTHNRRVDFKNAVQILGPGDAIFQWEKPVNASKVLSAGQWQQMPRSARVRIVHACIQRPGFRTREVTLVTTLLDESAYPAREILQAYCKRWRVEMCLDDLKTTLGMAALRCKSPDLAQKELLLFLTAHNLIRWVMAQAAQQASAPPEQISYKGTMDALRQWSQAIGQIPARQRQRRKRLWQKMLAILAADLVPKREGRKEPRAVKRRSKYPRLTKPRRLYEERWSRNRRRRASRAKIKPAH